MDPILYNAIIDGDEETLKKFLVKELLVEVTPFGRNTILHVAAQYKQEQIAQKILQVHDHLQKDDETITPKINEARLNIKAESNSENDNVSQAQSLSSSLLYKQNADGDTALHVAARVGCLNIIEHFFNAQDRLQDVEAGRPNMYLTKMRNQEDDTVLHIAARNGNLKVVEFLLKKDSELATQQNKAGESALFLAIERRNLDIAKHLLSERGDCAYGGREGMNALHAAVVLSGNDSQIAQKNLEDIITGILERKSSLVIEKDNILSWTPLHYAAYYDVPLYVNCLLRLREENKISYIPPLELERDKNGMSALHIAAANGNTLILRDLISKFPFLCEMLNNRGHTALHVAVKSGQEKVVYSLLCHNVVKNSEAFLNKQDRDGNTALHLAATCKDRGILRILLHNENVRGNIVNNKGLTIYDLAVDLDRTYEDPLLMELKSWMMLPITIMHSFSIRSFLGTRENEIIGLEGKVARIEAEMQFYEFETKSEVKQNIEDIEPPVTNKADDLESKGVELRSKQVVSKKSNTYMIQEMGKSILDMLTNKKAKKATENDMLIATIIATVTFAVAFQVPGGYESENKDKGLPILRSRYSFKVFIISNCMAFGFSSCSILLHFLAAKRKGSEHSDGLLRRGIASTFYSILTMVIAFISAIQLISSNSKPLQLAPYICAASFLFFFVYDTLFCILLCICLFCLAFVIVLPLVLFILALYCFVVSIVIFLDRCLRVHFLKKFLKDKGFNIPF